MDRPNLTPSHSQPPPGFHLAHDAISEEAWNEIRTWLDLDWDDPQLGFVFDDSDSDNPTVQHKSSSHIPWEISTLVQNRPVAQFGFRYDYQQDFVASAASSMPEIPAMLKRLLLDPLTEQTNESDAEIQHLFQQQPQKQRVTFTQCIINAYGANDTSHIPWHIDDDQFGPIIVVYTAGETRPLKLRCSSSPNHAKHYSCTAHPRHLSRYILSGEAREKWEHSVPTGKGWRISITFRSWREKEPWVG